MRKLVLILVAVAMLGIAAPASADDTVGLVNPDTGEWLLRNGGFLDRFFYGNPGDMPFLGDWDCDGIATPGMYRRSDGFVYLRNSNTQGVADVRFFFGNPGDVPLAGDFDGDGCDTVSIYRPDEGRFYIIDRLGANDGGLGPATTDYVFGDPGDKPFVGDFDGDGVETVGLHRETTGLVYFRQSHTQGNADAQFVFGDPGDRLVAGDWNGDGADSPALYRPLFGGDVLNPGNMFFRFTNTQGVADQVFCFTFGWPQGIPVAGDVGKAAPFVNLGACRPPPPPPTATFGNGVWRVGPDVAAGTYRMLSDGSPCYWARLRGFSGGLGDIITNEFNNEVEIVRILPSDAGFESDGCNGWSSDLAPRRPVPSAPWTSDGHLQVGSEIAPGMWRSAPQGGFCYWERLAGFTGGSGEILANAATTGARTVTIAPSDAGFFANRGCGTWTKVG